MNRKRLTQEAFDALFLEKHALLHRYAVHALREATGRWDPGRAEDAVQETFWVLWQRSEDYLAHPKPDKWLYQTLQFTLKNLLRSDLRWAARLCQFQQAQSHWQDQTAPPPGAALELEGLIPQAEFDLLVRLYLHGEPREDVARELGITRAALDKRISRSKEKFRRAYRALESDTDPQKGGEAP